jgi:hypothetical protein
MKNTIKGLKENMEKLLVISDMYEELLGRRITNSSEAEEAGLKYDYLRKKVLQLSTENRNLVRTTEIKDRP